MTDSILDDIWSKVKAVRIDHDLSDERLLHLGRIHLSLHELNAYIPPGRCRRKTFRHTAPDRAAVRRMRCPLP